MIGISVGGEITLTVIVLLGAHGQRTVEQLFGKDAVQKTERTERTKRTKEKIQRMGGGS